MNKAGWEKYNLSPGQIPQYDLLKKPSVTSKCILNFVTNAADKYNLKSLSYQSQKKTPQGSKQSAVINQ